MDADEWTEGRRDGRLSFVLEMRRQTRFTCAATKATDAAEQARRTKRRCRYNGIACSLAAAASMSIVAISNNGWASDACRLTGEMTKRRRGSATSAADFPSAHSNHQTFVLFSEVDYDQFFKSDSRIPLNDMLRIATAVTRGLPLS